MPIYPTRPQPSRVCLFVTLSTALLVLLAIAAFLTAFAFVADKVIEHAWGWAPTPGANNGKSVDDVLSGEDAAMAARLLRSPLTSLEVTDAMRAAHAAFLRRERWLKRRREIRAFLARLYRQVFRVF